MLKSRPATKEDIRVLDGIYEFILSLELDILKETGKEKFYKILEECFVSENDRFSYKYCDVIIQKEEILGFSFSYHYDNVVTARDYWFNHIVKKYNLSSNSIIFDYNEALPNELYLDTLYTFEQSRGLGVGTKLLKKFCEKTYPIKSLNVAQSNIRAKKLYESFGFTKQGEIWIGHENYDHMILNNN
ncbi:GNAT family N-acetyltransferase [Gemella sp. GH3]|uniref:GNAT family N-acetyltransferase n=1 Tax=unclassified Gemella TaxID=2624949 RepID=UPI0015D0CD8E|nr:MULTISPECIES: GNAT family N-acetyltransferase [unclassified Gemella]MBF0714635.1 GNAT family N-acetyltransferase [Gemella sp. GH3.1]NYS51587.1 GNAT family N-acetyltransferase [Gemella sp. GH3]